MPKKVNFSPSRRTPRGSYGGVRGLLDWLSSNYPAAYAGVKRTRPDLLTSAVVLNGLGDVSATGGALADKINQIAQAALPFLQLNAQRKLLNAQVARAKQGLPPLDVSNVTLPAARVEVDTGRNVSKYVKLAGAGLLALGALYVLRGGMRAQR